jgi:mannose PTS system EIIA component
LMRRPLRLMCSSLEKLPASLVSLADGVHVRVVTGVNVPMLWRTLCYADEPLEALVARALAGATQGVMQASPTRPQQQARGAAEDAKDHRHDQQ